VVLHRAARLVLKPGRRLSGTKLKAEKAADFLASIRERRA
jgi:hypothetical protein